MFGVVEIKGHQYHVRPGDIIDVEKISDEVGANVQFDRVLFIGGEAPVVGAPVVSGALVKALVIKQDKGPKTIPFKRFPGRWRNRGRGHRQPYTGLLITELTNGQGKTDKIAKDHRWAKKFLK